MSWRSLQRRNPSLGTFRLIGFLGVLGLIGFIGVLGLIGLQRQERLSIFAITAFPPGGSIMRRLLDRMAV